MIVGRTCAFLCRAGLRSVPLQSRRQASSFRDFSVSAPLVRSAEAGPGVLYRDAPIFYDEDGYGEEGADGDDDYVFRPELGFDDRHGAVHVGGERLEPEGAACLEALQRSGVCGTLQAACTNESDDEWSPFVMPWPSGTDDDVPLTMESALAALGFNEEFKGGTFEARVCFQALDEDYDNGEHPYDDLFGFAEEASASDIQALFGEPGPIVFYAGSGALNPLPVFVLGKMAPGVVGGFASTLVHT